jgi:3-phenylpropionate/trans-cinnamate dioxygenase ferredoxin reductase subunit
MSTQGTQRFVIIGGGLAASRAIEGIREVDQDAAIVLVGAEEHLPYERPPLSKDVLLDKKPQDSAYTHPQEWYDEQKVDLRLGTPATAIDTTRRTVTLADGSEIAWDRLLIATGSSPRHLDVEGADLLDVFYLRSMSDSAALRSRLVPGSNVVVIGAGWIGLEVAAAAREHGCEVTVVEPQPTPLFGVVGEEIGAWFADLHRRHGVELRLGEKVAGLAAHGTVEGQVSGVVLESGETLPADTVVVGIGITPNTGLAEAAGIEVDNGILCDEHLRTSVDGVYAAGDVANATNPVVGERVRVEHWANALNGGFAAGRAMAGEDVTYAPVPYFYSDQYDAGLEYSGHVPRGAQTEVVLRGDPESNEFMAFWLTPDGDGERVLAGMHVNVWDTIDAVKKLVTDRTHVDRAKLADKDVPLDQVAADA